ncbi:F420-dependent glucose-6-phosphate dehydrogenase [Ktedonobacter sp. SOSP1-52]|uniref:TIGR03557 family F420-dependent LLM class oxidoreductase n=1 Tax=Ktedonobacter sp. SOSP1-52 TaxID=2778366 RepID=UPI00191575DE|nr:TIGR03557 family F420-dependent LLM class oxidoreductase [Ktedonobacter sp. SOSP1-52]GHO71067.1 F420-dependent glucose-6-phosphate dehydrogenase [Ktedonobacter sp. SOSP1-52]
MVQFGWKAGPEQYPPVELMKYAIAADKAGFDMLDASDHFHPWSEEGQACFTWTWFGAVATQTQRITLSSGVTCPILRYHPSIIAQASATVTHFAPRRFALGVGTGEALNEFAATGQWPEYTERRDRLAEAIELIRALWTGEPVTYKGKYYHTNKARLYTPPTGPIPIIVSALVPHSAQFAGKYGDGLWSVGGKQPEIYQEIIKSFEESAREAGKDPKRMPRWLELTIGYSNNPEAEIQSRLKYWAGAHVPALFDQKIYTPKMSQENGEVVGADTLKKMGCFSSNPEDHVKFVKQYIELGFDHIIFHSGGPDQLAFIESYARDVLPKLHNL